MLKRKLRYVNKHFSQFFGSKGKQIRHCIFERKIIMAELRCICTYATEEQWLVTKILFWFGVAVVACLLAFFVILIIKDCIEKRRRRRHQHQRGRGRARRSTHEDERFEENCE